MIVWRLVCFFGSSPGKMNTLTAKSMIVAACLLLTLEAALAEKPPTGK